MAANQSSGGSRRSSTPKPTPPGPAVPAPGGRPRSWLRGGPTDGDVQTFRSPTALVIWVVWLLFAVANWIDLAVQNPDHTSAVAAAILLLATGIAYVTAQRPRIIADDAGVTVKNPVRDHRIGWASVTKVDLADLLRVHCDWNPGGTDGKKHRKVISSWAVHYSRRRRLAAEVRARRTPRRSPLGFGGTFGAGGFGAGGFGTGAGGRGFGDPVAGPPAARSASASTAEADAEMVVRLLSQRATAAQAETVWATGTVDIASAPADPPDPAASGPEVTGWLEPLQSTWSASAIAAVLIPALILLIVCLI